MDKIVCKCNAGFEDMLTVGKEYDICIIGPNDYMIVDDTDTCRYFGEVHFDKR